MDRKWSSVAKRDSSYLLSFFSLPRIRRAVLILTRLLHGADSSRRVVATSRWILHARGIPKTDFSSLLKVILNTRIETRSRRSHQDKYLVSACLLYKGCVVAFGGGGGGLSLKVSSDGNAGLVGGGASDIVMD